ncbi:MAG: thioredoxin [Betaproteobacteria bacterium HGW-Betaproteobacteria-7]|jgi:thioredoxin-related protein|nr:MAG: thioredoxin [Betaproteobacteria bacterium HGW-Betaproteobacteria-7]
MRGGLHHSLLLGVLLASQAGAADLPAAADLRSEAASAARSGQPLVVLYSRSDCRYCDSVRKDYLQPLQASAAHRGIVVRQINQDSERPLRDFRGQAATHAGIAAGEKIRLVPVVAFYGPDGRQLAPPIVGARIADYYQSYLDEALEKSAQALRRR